MFADPKGELIGMPGVRDKAAGVPPRATFINDPDSIIQHVSVNDLDVGRIADQVLRVLGGLQTDELCPCDRAVGTASLNTAAVAGTAHRRVAGRRVEISPCGGVV